MYNRILVVVLFIQAVNGCARKPVEPPTRSVEDTAFIHDIQHQFTIKFPRKVAPLSDIVNLLENLYYDGNINAATARQYLDEIYQGRFERFIGACPLSDDQFENYPSKTTEFLDFIGIDLSSY